MVFSLFTRKRRATQPALDTTVFDQVLKAGNIEDIKRLATQLLAFVDHNATSDAERALVMPWLARLATHPHPEVRAFTAEKARDCMRLDDDVAFAIMAGDDASALPFIAEAICLQNERMQLAVLRAGDLPRRQALCSRPDLSHAVLAEMTEQADRDTVLACLHNANIAFAPALARQLYVQFRQDEEVIAALLQRPDLPLEVRIAHAEIEAGRLREVMARRDWQTAQRAAAAAMDLEERALVDILADANNEEQLQAALTFLARRSKLTAAVLLRTACAGHVAVLIHALAWLARMRPSRLQGVLQPQASLGVARTALSRANIPVSAHALVLAVLLAARREGTQAATVGHRLVAFGPRILETIAETDALSVTEKMEAANMLQRVADEITRDLAAHFVQTLLRHAA